MKKAKSKILLIFSLCLLLGGCKNMEKEKVMTREEVKQEMLDYIENKYNEEFEVYNIEYGSWDNGGIEIMRAYPKGEESYNYFFVTRKGKNDITDDYVLFTMEHIYEEKIIASVKKYFPDAVVRAGISSSSPIPDSFRPDMNFNEFEKFANKTVDVGCSVYLVAEKEEDIDSEKRKLLKKELMKINDVGNITYVGYSAKEFETYVINDPYNSIETHSSYSTNGLKVEIDEDWGEIDFDYEYKENE